MIAGSGLGRAARARKLGCEDPARDDYWFVYLAAGGTWSLQPVEEPGEKPGSDEGGRGLELARARRLCDQVIVDPGALAHPFSDAPLKAGDRRMATGAAAPCGLQWAL